jgi:hypothetical protein
MLRAPFTKLRRADDKDGAADMGRAGRFSRALYSACGGRYAILSAHVRDDLCMYADAEEGLGGSSPRSYKFSRE